MSFSHKFLPHPSEAQQAGVWWKVKFKEVPDVGRMHQGRLEGINYCLQMINGGWLERPEPDSPWRCTEKGQQLVTRRIKGQSSKI